MVLNIFSLVLKMDNFPITPLIENDDLNTFLCHPFLFPEKNVSILFSFFSRSTDFIRVTFVIKNYFSIMLKLLLLALICHSSLGFVPISNPELDSYLLDQQKVSSSPKVSRVPGLRTVSTSVQVGGPNQAFSNYLPYGIQALKSNVHFASGKVVIIFLGSLLFIVKIHDLHCLIDFAM